MWGKPNEGQPTQNQPGTAATSAPAAASQSSASTPKTIVGKTMKIVGEVTSSEELYLEGDLEGSLTLRNKLTIGPGSKVNASVKAEEVIVYGTVKGNVEAQNRISLRAGASIVGDIKTAGIVIEDGAYFKGGIDISRGDAAKTATNEPPKAAAQGAGGGQKR